jgi:flagellar basal-body rod protein FlgB
MPISDMPILQLLRTRMQWHQERQKVLSENVANVDTPNYRPRDLVPLNFDHMLASPGVTLVRTEPGHMGSTEDSGGFTSAQGGRYEVRPAGNAVSLEDEMMKVAANQMDYQAVTSLYSRSLGLLKIALGKSG